MAAGDVTVRSFRTGDEQETAALFNRYTEGFTGPFAVTPQSWLAQYRKSWRSPGLEEDPECVRVATRNGKIVGHSVADYRAGETAIVQELCVAEESDAVEIARVLLSDVEERCRGRGKTSLLLCLSDEDGLVARVAGTMGYEFARGTRVFMSMITNLGQFLREIQSELTRRLTQSELRRWTGGVMLCSGDMRAGLYLRRGQVKAATVVEPAITVELEPDALPLLLLGRLAVGEAYLQDRLTIAAEDRAAALRLLDVLFPRTPMLLPRAQWW